MAFITASYAAANGSTHEDLPPQSMVDVVHQALADVRNLVVQLAEAFDEALVLAAHLVQSSDHVQGLVEVIGGSPGLAPYLSSGNLGVASADADCARGGWRGPQCLYPILTVWCVVRVGSVPSPHRRRFSGRNRRYGGSSSFRRKSSMLQQYAGLYAPCLISARKCG